MKNVVYLSLLGISALAICLSRPAKTQSAGGFVALQPNSPGSVQPGNTNISGTSRAASFVGAGSGLTSLSWSSLPDLGLTNNKIQDGVITSGKLASNGAAIGNALIYNGSSVVWGTPSATLSLPYSGSTSANGTAFDITTSNINSRASRFSINNNQNSNFVIEAVTNGFGIAGQFSATNSSHQNPVLVAVTQGQGPAANFLINNVSNSAPALLVSTNGSGDAGLFEGNVAVNGRLGVGGYESNSRIFGNGNGSAINGVSGHSDGLNGVQGISQSSGASGVYGANTFGYGVAGRSSFGYAGFFDGFVLVTGNLQVAGFKNFKIDHPVDPENKFLLHYNLECDQPLNVYRGNIVLDESGEGVVELPKYVDAIGKDFHYQLTPIGAPADLFVKKKFETDRFVIGGGKPRMEVSWTLTSVRDDAYARAHGAPTEVLKKPEERGRYIHPEFFGRPRSEGLYANVGIGKSK